MAYTSAPETQTYSTQTIPLVYGIDLRAGYFSTNKDAGMVNVLPFKSKADPEDQSLWGETRYALNGVTVNSTAGNICRGLYVWEKAAGSLNYAFVVIGTKVYSSDNGVTWTHVDTLLTNATTPVRFTEFIDATNTKKLVLVDGVEGYVYTSNAAGTKITDADFPTPHIPFPVFVDGYLFLAKAGTGDIYNSDLNDPAAWTAGSFISSELYPDDIQALLKINNYVVAVGTQGIEYFYDAANATASPLARDEGLALPFGTQFPNSIAFNKDVAVLLGNNNDGELVLRMIEDNKFQDIPCTFLVSVLENAIRSGNATYNTLRSYFLRQRGELFYVITFDGTVTSNNPAALARPTFIYSFATGLWSELRYSTNTIFPVTNSTGGTTGHPYVYVAGALNGAVFFGTYTDSASSDALDGSTNVSIYQELRTVPHRHGTLNRKMCSRVGLIYNKVVETDETPTISYTDDNYTTLSTARSLAGTITGADGGFPFITQLGSFRQRAWVVYSNVSTPTQWHSLEIDINKGQQ